MNVFCIAASSLQTKIRYIGRTGGHGKNVLVMISQINRKKVNAKWMSIKIKWNERNVDYDGGIFTNHKQGEKNSTSVHHRTSIYWKRVCEWEQREKKFKDDKKTYF